MTDDQLDDALDALRRELTVTPSPGFAAGVRARTTADAAPTFWTRPAWLGIAAAGVLAASALVMWRDARPEAPAPAPAARASSPAPGTEAGTPAVTTSHPAAETFAAAKPAPARSRAASRAVRAQPAAGPEVLVPPDQLQAIQRLMAAVRAGTPTGVPPAPAVFDADTGELMPVRPIEIPLITVDPLPGNPDSRSGGRENR